MTLDFHAQQTKYPMFIQNRPCGIDKFEGGSQKKLAKTIAHHFVFNDSLETDALPRIIGLEGTWGSGKSNVVKILEKELSDDYYFFDYDAWGHQEDLQRRSILELLTSKLIEDDILYGDTTIKIKGGGEKSVTWTEKLKYLLARKTETVTEKYPRISTGMIAVFMVTVLTPIFTFIAYAVKPNPTTWWFSLVSILIAALPVIVALCIWYWAYHKNHKYGLSYLLAIYQDKIENDICYETLSEEEPTVNEFKAWMQDISNFIGEKKRRKLVIVFDNMDRLPAEKVKELWSSIHTFFADCGFANIWAVIPFDESHLACAFGDESNEKTKQLTKYFINKTFPIVYRVAPPVITDYRNIFDELFIEAFGDKENASREAINRIFRLVNTNANVREIISFINELVALRQEWGEVILMENIAVFCLKKHKILANPVEQILSGEYLEGIQTIINNNMQTQREIAALVYGVDVEHARQIPLTKYIENCIAGETGFDLNEYCETNKQFDTVLEEVVRNTDKANIDKIISCLDTLTRKNERVLRIWQHVTRLKLEETIFKQEFPLEYRKLLLHLEARDQEKVISNLYQKLFQFTEFDGADYYHALNEIQCFMAQYAISFDLWALIERKTVEPKIFVDYIRAANETPERDRISINFNAYEMYLLETDQEALDTYLAQLLPDNFNHKDIVETLKNSSIYTFPKLYQSITNCISNKSVNSNNVGDIFATYRLLSNEEGPLSIRLDLSIINQILTELEADSVDNKDSGYYDLVAMKLANNSNVSLTSGAEVKYLAELMDYYVEYGNLLVSCISRNNSLLNAILQYMVNHNMGSILSLTDILPHFESIKMQIDVTDKAFIEHLACWNVEDITRENIKEIIPNASFYGLTTQISNNLTNHINQKAIEALTEVSVDALYSQKAHSNTFYWLIATKYLLSKIEKLPDNLTEFGKKILFDIAFGIQSASQLSDSVNGIINKLDKRKTKAVIKDIRNAFCNGTKIINNEIFQYFESWFRSQGDLLERTDSINKILKPIISDPNCLKLILEHEDFYINLINEGKDDSFELKQSFQKLILCNTDEKIIEFAKKIEIDIAS